MKKTNKVHERNENMKSLVILNYLQPAAGEAIRFGIVETKRDTVKDPVIMPNCYRWYDRLFRRSRTLLTCRTLSGWRQFYAERTIWKIEIPFVGSLLSPLFKLFDK